MPDKTDTKALEFDAYFVDEFGVVNIPSNVNEKDRIGLHKSVFTDFTMSQGTIKESSRSGSETITNKADPTNNPTMTAKSGYVRNPVEVKGLSHGLMFYFSEPIIDYWKSLPKDKKVWDTSKAINITLLFAVGTELNRSGIRSFFQKNNDFAAIILVPGIEPGQYENNKSRWGVSLNDADIARLLKKFFSINVPYKIVILACYSPGMNGLNQTILNEIVDLKDVIRIVIFDCLYLVSSGPTVDTLKKIKYINPNVQIIIYWSSVSKSANSLDDSNSQLLVIQQARPVVTTSSNLIKVAGKKSYRALICARIAEAGTKENLLNLSQNANKAFQALEKIIPARGDIISDKTIYKSVYGAIPATKVILDDWYYSNRKVVEDFYKFVDAQDGTTQSIISQIWGNALLGWHGTVGSETHDLLIPEFGWEYLPYRK